MQGVFVTTKRVIISLIFFLLPWREVSAVSVKVWHEIQHDQPSWVKAEGIMKAEPEKVWSYFIRFNDYARFMPQVVDSFFISAEGIEAIRRLQESGGRNANTFRKVAKRYKVEASRRRGELWEGFVFMVLGLPFPFENRWYVIRVILDESKAETHVYKRCWDLVVGNIRGAKGCWTLAPTQRGDETIGRYEDQVDPGGNIPTWVTKMGATQTVPQMFEGLEKVTLQGWDR